MNITRNRVELSSSLTHAESVRSVIVGYCCCFFPFVFSHAVIEQYRDASIWFGSVFLSKTDSIHSQHIYRTDEWHVRQWRTKRNVCKNSRKKHTVQHNTTQQHKITCSMLVCIMLCSGFDMCLLAQLNSDGMTMICASSLTCMWLLQSKHAPVVCECVYITC